MRHGTLTILSSSLEGIMASSGLPSAVAILYSSQYICQSRGRLLGSKSWKAIEDVQCAKRLTSCLNHTKDTQEARGGRSSTDIKCR
jgi:hypothetical protein